MSKDIRKNREALIRYFLTRGEQRRDIADCAKCRTLECFGFEPFKDGDYLIDFAGTHPLSKEARIVTKLLDINEEQWHEMENYFEGWTNISLNVPVGKKTFQQVASWLQTLPGWPRVL